MTCLSYARRSKVARSSVIRLSPLSLFAVSCAVLFLVIRPSNAADRPTLAGVWNVGPLTERWNIGDWGKACGPRPAPRDQPGGQVAVRDEAGELVITGLGRTYRTNECWEQLPGVSRATHSAADHAWHTRCTSAPNDPRQTALVTAVTANDTTIAFDETGEYQFRIEGQNCTASARRSRTYVISQRQGQLPPSAVNAPPPGVQPQPTVTAAPIPRPDPLAMPPSNAPTTKPVPAVKCASPSEPTRLEVRPARKWLAPGQRFAFRAIALDAEGCAVDAKITWTLATPNAKVALAPGGNVTIADDSPDGTVELTVSFAGRSVPVFIEVASPARFEALLSTGSINDAGEGDEAPATIAASGSLGANPAVASDTAHSRKTTFVAIIGGLAIGLAFLGFVLLRRGLLGQRAASADTVDFAAPPGVGATPQGLVVPTGRSFPGQTVICPSCRSEFPAGSTFCPHDGNRLAPAGGAPFPSPGAPTAGGLCPTCGRGYDPGVKTCPVHGDDLVPVAVYRATVQQASAVPERGKICPSCGGRYGGQATFCGKDGTALVLVN